MSSGSESLAIWNELAFEPGVLPDRSELCLGGPESFRNLCARMSPKLRLPVVDVEFLPDGGSDKRSCDLINDPMVDERPLAPSRGGTKVPVGVEVPECADKVECFLVMAGPGEPSGALVKATAEEFGDSAGVSRRLKSFFHLTPCVDVRLGDIDFRP